GTIVALGAFGGFVHVLRVGTGERIWTFEAHRTVVTMVILDRSNRWMLTGGNEGDLRLWDLERRQLMAETTLPDQPDKPLSAAFSPTGRKLYVGTSRGLVAEYQVVGPGGAMESPRPSPPARPR
ncbi:MAG: hypothetical protein HY815_15355, partial [Candidatus Riflebacteria bacterium]|nr:hypothetical protein [Candidatus Riflebacteria bacterium]